jgi:hypothetical protein
MPINKFNKSGAKQVSRYSLVNLILFCRSLQIFQVSKKRKSAKLVKTSKHKIDFFPTGVCKNIRQLTFQLKFNPIGYSADT